FDFKSFFDPRLFRIQGHSFPLAFYFSSFDKRIPLLCASNSQDSAALSALALPPGHDEGAQAIAITPARLNAVQASMPPPPPPPPPHSLPPVQPAGMRYREYVTFKFTVEDWQGSEPGV